MRSNLTSSPSIGLIESTANLLISEKYSDLTITTQTRSFKVHRAIVCTQSKVLAAMSDSGFKETSTSTLPLQHDDPAAVERMIAFLYTGDYDHENADATAKDAEQPSADAALMANALVYSIADKYDIECLKALAKRKFQNVDRDRELRDIVIDTCAKHIDEALASETWSAFFEENGAIGLEIFRVARLRSKAEARVLAKASRTRAGLFRCLRTGDVHALDIHHAEYTSMYKKQKQLLEITGDVLRTAIIQFSYLEEVGPSTRTPRMAFSFPPTDNRDGFERWQKSVPLNLYDVDHAAIILRAVSQARSVARTSIDTGKMFGVMDAMVINRPDLRKHIQRLVRNMRKLELFLIFDMSSWQHFFSEGKCKSFLRSMERLDSFQCKTFGVGIYPTIMPEIEDIFGGNTWQNLSRLALSRFYMSAGELSSLLGRHGSTLKAIFLQHIQLHLESWYDAFIELRGASLCVVRVYHLIEQSWAMPFDRFKELHFDQIRSSDALDAFLFQGGPWGPHMNRELASLELEENKGLEEDETEDQITADQRTAPIS